MRIALLVPEIGPAAPAPLGVHAWRLGLALTAAGHDVVGLGRPAGDVMGMHVLAPVEYPPLLDTSDLLSRALQDGTAMTEQALRAFATTPPDVIHAFGWESAWSAAAIKGLTRATVVSTLDATQAGRARGRTLGEDERVVFQAEWWLTYESRRTILPTADLRREAEGAFELPREKQDVIAEPPLLRTTPPRRATRVDPESASRILYARTDTNDRDALAVAIDATALVRRAHPDAVLWIGGAAPDTRQALRSRSRRRGISSAVRFTSAWTAPPRTAVALALDTYVPVARAAMDAIASGLPCVGSDMGAHTEAAAGQPALRVAPPDAASIAGAVDELLGDDALRARLAQEPLPTAAAIPGWDEVARRTADVYRRAIDEERERLNEGRPPLRVILGRSPLLADRPVHTRA